MPRGRGFPAPGLLPGFPSLLPGSGRSAQLIVGEATAVGPTLTQASAALPRPGLAPGPHLRGHWCPVVWRLLEVREGRLSTGDAGALRMASPNCALAEPGQFFLVLPGRAPHSLICA